jgi:rubrerythrin
MEFFIEEAFRVAVLTEKNSLDFYRSAAAKVSGGRGKQMLEQLASEEAGHVEEILRLYCGANRGILLSAIERPGNLGSPALHASARKPGGQMTERQILGLALCREQSCIDQYEIFVATFREPGVRKVFQEALQLSRRHYQVLEEKYRHLARHQGDVGRNVGADLH